MSEQVIRFATEAPHDLRDQSSRIGSESASDAADIHAHRLPKGQAVFIHSSWRTSSTWFWQKFRELPTTLCFYEPFNSHLASISRKTAATHGPNSWKVGSGIPIASGHPGDAPYFTEYGPLIRRSGGVRLYRQAMDTEWFLPTGGLRGRLRDAELRYVALLLRLAERQGRVPVLGFTRSLGRLFPMKAAFPGVHILLRRNLWTQWASFLDQKRQGNAFFYLKILQMYAGRDDLFLNFVRNSYLHKAASLYLSKFAGGKGELQKPELDRQLFLSLPEADIFAMFIIVHIYLYVHAEFVADVVVDTTRMARDTNYRRITRQQLADLSGCLVSLSDSLHRQQFVTMMNDAPDWEEIERQLKFAIRTLPADMDPAQADRIVSELLGATREEADTSERYLAGARRQIGAMADELSKRAGEVAQLHQERDAIVRSREEALAERDRIVKERDELIRTSEAVLESRAWLVQERDRSLEARNEAIAERDRIVKERDDLVRALEIARSDTARMTRERDDLVRALEIARSDRVRMTRERDDLVRANETTRAEWAALNAEIEAVREREAALNDQLIRLKAEYADLRAKDADGEAIAMRLHADIAVLRDRLAAAEQRRDDLTGQSARWFEAATASLPLDPGTVFRLFPARLGGTQVMRYLAPHVDRRRRALGRAADEARDRRQWELAARHYRERLTLDPDNAAIWIQYGHCLKEAGQIEAAREAYAISLKAEPKSAVAYFFLGEALQLLGRVQEAGEAFRTSVSLDSRLLEFCPSDLTGSSIDAEP